MPKDRLVKRNSSPKSVKHQRRGLGVLGNFTMAVSFAVGLLVIGSGIYYLNILNNKARVGYEMAEMENKLAKIEDANKNLEIEISSLRQVERIQAAAEKLGMGTTGKTEYLVGKKESLARK